MTTVYKIKNVVTGAYYIGCTGDMEMRIKTHFNSLSKGKHPSCAFQEDFNKHGEASFITGVVKRFRSRDAALEKKKHNK